MFRIFGKLSHIYRTVGPADATTIIIDRALSAVFGDRVRLRRYYVLSQPLAAIPKLPPRRGAAIEIRQIQSDDPVLSTMPRPKSEIAARFQAGASCFTAELGGELTGFLWYVTGSWDDPETNVQFRLKPEFSSVWDFDVYVALEHRVGFVFYKLWDYAAQHFAARGITDSGSIVWAHNEDSVRAHRRLGAYPVGSALHITIGPWVLHIADRSPRITWIRPGKPSPKFDITVGSQARRLYRRFQNLPSTG